MKKLNLDCVKIINLYNKGLSCKQIAQEFNVTYDTINKRLKQYNIKLRKINEYYSMPTYRNNILLQSYKDKLINKKFNKLTIIDIFKKNQKTYCKCLCECGKYKDIWIQSIKAGHSKSCGCLVGG